MTPPPPRTPRVRLPRAQRSAQLLDVAEGLFADRGFEHTNMEDIAREAGVTRPVVYDHFPTKESVLLACVSRARADLEAQLGELGPMLERGETIENVLDRGGRLFFNLLARNPRRWAVLFSPSSALSSHLADELMVLRARTVERLVEVARGLGVEADDERLHAYAHAVSGVGEQLGRWWVMNRSVPLERVVAHHSAFVLHGLAPLLPPAPAPREDPGEAGAPT